MDKLVSLHDGIIGSEVTLRVDNTDEPANKIAEIKLLVPGNDLFARKQSKSFEEAADIAVEALRRQLTKHKEKLRGE
jgi:putative sigma-54 modulation protein